MRFLKKLLPFAVIAGAALLLLYLPDIGPERYTDLATFFRTELKRQACTGYTVAAVEGGSVLYVDAFGVDGSGIPLTTDTPFLLGPVSQSFTGLLCLSLVRDKFLDLDEPLSDGLPGFGFAPGSAYGEGRTVSLRHLLSHTSGVSPLGFDDLHPQAQDLDAAVRGLVAAYPEAPPGVLFRPLDTGYEAVGLAIEEATGQSFEAQMSLRVFKPLGMARTSASPSLVGTSLPKGSVPFFGVPIPRQAQAQDFAAPATSLVSTATDMAAYLSYCASPEKFPRTPVPARFMRPLFEPLLPASPYGYGWLGTKASDAYQAGGAGYLQGFSASLTLWPKTKSGLVILFPQNGFIHSRLVLPALAAGARSIMQKGETPRPFPFGRLYILLGVMAAVQLLVLLFQIGAALDWSRNVRCKVEAVGSPGPLRLAVILTGLGIGLRLALLVLLPGLAGQLLGRPMPWSEAFGLEPGFAAWLMVTLVGGMARNAARLAWLVGPR